MIILNFFVSTNVIGTLVAHKNKDIKLLLYFDNYCILKVNSNNIFNDIKDVNVKIMKIMFII